MKHELIGKKFQILDDGFVCLLDYMGDDRSITDAARISYGEGTRPINDDKNLLRYLYRHKHLSPFEMVSFKFYIRLPIVIMRQLVRHRTAKINETSARYSIAIDSALTTSSDAWRTQSTINKQGSAGTLTAWPEDISPTQYLEEHGYEAGLSVGDYLTRREAEIQHKSLEVYEERLKLGIAREQARKDLPLSTYTEIFWKMDLRNLLHFLSLRMDSHAQYEFRCYANKIYEIVKEICPLSVEAFDDYDPMRGALMLTALDIKVINSILCDYKMNGDQRTTFGHAVDRADVGWPGTSDKKSREQEECWEKLKRLGFINAR